MPWPNTPVGEENRAIADSPWSTIDVRIWSWNRRQYSGKKIDFYQVNDLTILFFFHLKNK